MKTKADFQDAIAAAISGYPLAAQRYQARDPILLAQLDAMATMLALYSAEQDVAAMEPFTKARDVTVLADAAVKGILPFGSPQRARIAVANSSAVPLVINAGRRLQDMQGRTWVVDTGATVAPSATGTVTAYQRDERTITHTVTASQPFYRIEVTQPQSGRYIASVRVVDGSSNEYTYQPDFVNVETGATVFNLLTDEARKLYVEFGATGLVGYQPGAGESFSIIVTETEGAVSLSPGSQFAFEYSTSLYDAGAKLTLDAVLSPGAAPMDIATMREVTAYPSIYSSNAVYLASFDFVIRRKLSPFRFLSVWNEQVEESVRGASVNNINTLFIAAQKDGVSSGTLQSQITAIVKAADDSYKLSFVSVVETTIAVAITAYVSTAYDFTAVEQQIRELILANYGRDSAFAKRGRSRILNKAVYDLLEANVPALQGAISDFDVTITNPIGGVLPEEYRYVSTGSLTITVSQAE